MVLRRVLALAATMVFAAPLMAAESGTGDDLPDDLTEEQRAALIELMGDLEVDAQERLTRADNAYQEARAHFRAFRMIEAREACQRALRILPSYEPAQDLLDRIEAITGRGQNSTGRIIAQIAEIDDVAQQENATRIARRLEEAERLMALGDYVEAANQYDMVLIAIRAFPYDFDWGDLPAQVRASMLEAQARARDAELATADRLRTIAEREARWREQMQEDALRARVDEILTRAWRAYDRMDFRRAQSLAWQAYELDRRREDARQLWQLARQEGHELFEETYAEERNERLARVNENIHIALIPQAELLEYPEDWFRRDLREAPELGQTTVEPWRDALNAQLEQEVDFDWEDTDLFDAVDFLRNTTGVNIVVDTEVTLQNPPPITLRASGMTLRRVLGWMMEMTDLRMSIRNEAVFISTDESTGDMALRMYDINDLVSPVRDFPGRELAYNATGGGGGGGGGFGNIFGDDGGGDEPRAEPEDVLEFIEEAVAPDSWDVDGATIDIRTGGTLFVRNTPEVHVLVEQLLNRLRSQSSLQVNMRIRLLDVNRNFFEEIGIEWHDLLTDPGNMQSTTEAGVVDVGSDWLYSGGVQHNLPSNSTLNPFPPAFGGLSLEHSINLSNTFDGPQLNMVLEAIETETDSQVLQAPEITCFNGQRANAQFITQYAYIADYDVVVGAEGGGTLDPIINILNFGDIIDVRPVVSADRKYVTVEMRPSSVLLQSTFTEVLSTITTVAGTPVVLQYPLELPLLEVRTLRSTIMLPDRGSLMLGGYVRGLRQRTHTGIPFLSHIPFLGRLFSRNGIYDENRHLFFLLSVHIIALDELEAEQ